MTMLELHPPDYQLLHTEPQYFERYALKLFSYQSQYCHIYKEYLAHVGIDPIKVDHLNKIPYLPISFFKTHAVVTKNYLPDMAFYSSTTTGQIPSVHYVYDVAYYLNHALYIFQSVYGNIKNFEFFALLPGYLERKNSSLVAMIHYFMQQSGQEEMHFYLHNFEELSKRLQAPGRKKKLLIGVTFALLDFAKQHPTPLSDVIIIETGGMKGRGDFLPREKIHEIICKSFEVKAIHSEYGMTELMSQAYSQDKGIFVTPITMRYTLRRENDPFEYGSHIRRGGINIIDLANVHTCAFIETQDAGLRQSDNAFCVLGRLDNTEARGCNLLYTA